LQDGAMQILDPDLPFEITILRWPCGAAPGAKLRGRRNDNRTWSEISPYGGRDGRINAKCGHSGNGKGGGNVERTGAGNDHGCVIGDMGSELAQVPFATSVVKAGMGKDGFRPGIEQFRFRRNPRANQGNAGMIKKQRGEAAKVSSGRIARIPGAAGMNAHQPQPGKTGIHFGASLVDLGSTEEEIGLEAIGWKAGGTGAIEKDIGKMALAGANA